MSIVLPVALLLVLGYSCREKFARQESAKATFADVAMTESPAASGDREQANNHAAAPDTSVSSNQAPQRPGTPHDLPAKQDWDKKIIKNATVSVEVKAYKTFNDLVHTAAKQSGGYIAQEEQNETDYKIENTITIKVPVDQFDNLLTALTPAKEKVLIKKITSQDVTGEVVDTKSRLEAKRQVRLRYLDLLKQAKNMEEILQVQNEINDIQEHMESAAGRINYLTHAAAFSTIQLSFFEVLDARASDTKEPSFGQKILLALQSGLLWMGELLILLVTLWPIWMALAIVWWVFRKWKMRKVFH